MESDLYKQIMHLDIEIQKPKEKNQLIENSTHLDVNDISNYYF